MNWVIGSEIVLVVLDEHLVAGNRLEQFRAANARLQYDAQLKRSSISVDVKHSIIAKIAEAAQALPDSMDAEYAMLTNTEMPPFPTIDYRLSTTNCA